MLADLSGILNSYLAEDLAAHLSVAYDNAPWCDPLFIF